MTHQMKFRSSSHLNYFQPKPLDLSDNNHVMFPFPYKDIGKCFDCASSDLVIFGHSLFSFMDEFSYCMPYDAQFGNSSEEGRPFMRVVITKRQYFGMKADLNITRNGCWVILWVLLASGFFEMTNHLFLIVLM